MIKRAKENNYYVDAREFKTTQQYSYDTFLFTKDTLFVVNTYIENIRPLLGPCDDDDFLLVTTTGTRYEKHGEKVHPKIT